MVDLRYVGLTLIGIFLALAVGLMIGSALGSPDRQAAAFESLRGQFELLRSENEAVRAESSRVRRGNEARERALKELAPGLVRGRLEGVPVLVVLCGSVDERAYWRDLEDTLRIGGVQDGGTVRIPDLPRALRPEDRRRLGELFTPGDISEEPEPFEAVGWLARGLVSGAPPDRLEELARLIGAELRGNWRGPSRRVLMLTGATTPERAQLVQAGEVPELRFCEESRAVGARVVACEPEHTEPSAVDALAARGATTVDNIDSVVGQVSAVLALAGAEGRFGSGPGAGRPLPPLER